MTTKHKHHLSPEVITTFTDEVFAGKTFADSLKAAGLPDTLPTKDGAELREIYDMVRSLKLSQEQIVPPESLARRVVASLPKPTPFVASSHTSHDIRSQFATFLRSPWRVAVPTAVVVLVLVWSLRSPVLPSPTSTPHLEAPAAETTQADKPSVPLMAVPSSLPQPTPSLMKSMAPVTGETSSTARGDSFTRTASLALTPAQEGADAIITIVNNEAQLEDSLIGDHDDAFIDQLLFDQKTIIQLNQPYDEAQF